MKPTAFKANVLALLMAFSAASAFAVPRAVEEAFESKYPEVEPEEWQVDSNGFWETAFTEDGKEYRADFTEEGFWVETERSIEFEDLPDKIKRAIRMEFGSDEISEIEVVDHSSRGRFYDVEFVRPGENQDVEYDVYGKRVGAIATVIDGLQTPVGTFNKAKSPADMGRLDLLFEFGFNLLTIFIFAWVIYYRRHHDHQMLFLLLGFNLFLFPIFLVSTSLTAGFGFTLFALLALVRLRSDTFSKTEVAYLLGAVALTFINAMLPARIEMVSSLVVLATAWAGDHPRVWRGAYQTARIRYRTKDTTTMLDKDYLRERVAEEFRVEVNNIEIDRVDKNQVRLTVMYRELPEVRKSRRDEEKQRKRRKGKGRPAQLRARSQTDE
ncbi:MAG: DUF4956 domain-containing protein [Verrucomicrobiales bacterium]